MKMSRKERYEKLIRFDEHLIAMYKKRGEKKYKMDIDYCQREIEGVKDLLKNATSEELEEII